MPVRNGILRKAHRLSDSTVGIERYTALLFRKRNRRPGTPPTQGGAGERSTPQQFYFVDFDMMTKGSIVKRRRETVRQFGVTVNGSTRLVTSGDTVDAATYNALLAAQALRPAPAVTVESEDPAVDDERE